MNTLFHLMLTYWWATLILFFFLIINVFGVVHIGEQQVGLVIKRFAMRSLPPGEIIALNGEAGFQADTLPPGLHFGYWKWQYSVQRMPMVVVPQGDSSSTCVTAPPDGRLAFIWVELTMTRPEAVCPLNFTEDTLSRFLPLIVIVVPAVPVAGEICATEGS